MIDLINKLPEELTLEDKDKVEVARTAYDALTEAQRALVTNYVDLEAAEAKIAELEADKAAADAVINEIATLPSAEELTLEDKDAVEAVRTAYDALTDTRKALVTNLDKLTAAEAKIGEL